MYWFVLVGIWWLFMGVAFAPAAESDYRKSCRVRGIPVSSFKARICFVLTLIFWPLWVSYQECRAIMKKRPR